MRGPLTLQERLEAARAELWLCRLACDLTLARWAAVIPQPDPAAPSEPVRSAVPDRAEQATSWPVWQPIWLHERCRPIVGRVVTAR